MKWTLVCIGLVAAGSVSAFQVAPLTRSSSSRALSSVTQLSAFVDINENAGRDVGTMEEWVSACGVQKVDGIQLTTQDGMDWSAITNEPLGQGSPVVNVPNGMILSSTRVRDELGGSVSEAVNQLARYGAQAEVPMFYLFVKILTLYQEGDQSPWFPWLNSLPRLYFNAVSMTDFCYECLPPLVYRYARAERVKFDNFCNALKQVNIISPDTKENTALLKWAFNVVQTRSWGGPDEKVIVPMIDMFNHATDPDIAVGYDDEGNCVAYTTKNVEAGSPLTMSYGDPTNPSLLFAIYGFLDESSPATFCKITNIQPTDELRNLGFDFSRMLFYKETGDVSEEVWDIMLYQVLNSNKADQQAFYNAHMNGDADTKSAIHQHYFAETSTALKNHVDSFLVQLEDLSLKSEGKDLNEHPRLPLILRHNEFVKNTFLTVKSRLDPMVEQAVGQREYA